MPEGLPGRRWTVPDGVALDTEGKLWVAVFNGARVLRIDPASGALLSALEIPAKQVTSVAFGGADLDELYVTTACVFLPDDPLAADDRAKYPDSGAVFRVTGLGVRGFPGRPARL